MSVESAWPDVVDALYTLAIGTSGFQAGDSAGSLIPVYDTTVALAVNDVPGSLLVIGWPGEPDDGPVPPGEGTQGLATLGTTHARDEVGEVNCLASSRLGDIGTPGDRTQIRLARTTCFALVNSFGATLRANPGLGLMGNGYRNVTAYISRVQPVTWLNEGPVTQVLFTVHYTARI